MIALAALTALAGPSWDALDDAGWRDVGTRRSDVGDVAIRRAEVDGIGCVEGRVTVDVAPAALLAVTDDMVSSPSWSSANLPVSEELARDATGFVLLQVFDSPGWTLSADRLWVIRGHADPIASRYRWQREPASAWAEAVARHDIDAIELAENYGEWSFTPTATGTDLRYRACADLGGRLPERLQTWVATRQVPDLVSELVQEARRRSG